MKIKWNELKTTIDEMYQSGLTIEEMSQAIGIKAVTLENKLYEWGYKNLHVKRQFVREFWCRWCGTHVTADPMMGDKRTVFCSHACEKKYWKKPKRYGTGMHLVFGEKK